MAYKIKIEKFEGPLDLLLQLIEQQQLDITEVSLSSVTEQYLNYLNQAAELNPEELADFLVVAAKLLVIKSRALLPTLAIEEEEGTDLEIQLKIYKEFYEASKILHKRILRKKFSFPRERTLINIKKVFNPPRHLTVDKMKELFLGVLKEIEQWVSLPKEVMIKTISIREKIENIKRLILAQATLSFRNILTNAKNKTEVIVTFLALLELVKQRTIIVVQEKVFEDIVITRLTQE